MKDTLRRVLRLLLLAVFLISTVLLLHQTWDKHSSRESQDQALAIALGEKTEEAAPVAETLPAEVQPMETQPPELVWIPEPVADDPEIAELEKIDLDALRQVNPEVIGWIRIPGTRVDYPLLQGEDNEFYLKHNWDKKKNYVGSVYLEHRNSPELSDFNTIIYAHNMNDGSMFGILTKYTDAYYWRGHPYVYILTDAGVWRYEVFSSYKAEVESPTYGLSFNQKQTKVDFVRHILDSSRYDTDIVPSGYDRVLTLSTCSGLDLDNRWVVHARLKMIQVPADNAQ